MKESSAVSGYRYTNAGHSCAHAYLLPVLNSEAARIRSLVGSSNAHLFDLGCGNGSVGAELANLVWSVTGVDPSAVGIATANAEYPDLRLEIGSAYDDLVATHGRFPLVISLEVVEHVYAPRDYARTLYDLVEPVGTAIVSTPYHGYEKTSPWH